MIVGFALVLAGQLAPDSTRAAAGPRMDATVAGVRATADTLPRRRRAVAIEYSDAYSTRQTIHKISSMAMLPLFAAQYVSGQQLMLHGADAAPWARSSHGVLAGAVGTLFAVNTVTGGLNLWEGRKDPNHRACLLYTSPSPRDGLLSRMPSSA